MKLQFLAIFFVLLFFAFSPKSVAQINLKQSEACLSDIKTWANDVAQKGETRTLHLYRPMQDENSDEISVFLYTPMEVYCEAGCERTPEDEEAYSFYRSTHYWTLKKVFYRNLMCAEQEVEIDKSLSDGKKQLSRELITEDAEIKLTWNADKCVLNGASEVAWGGCISIMASPK